MSASVRNKLLLVVSLAILSVRALTPDGYMPGSKGSGLLFELCPSGMPAEIMQALAGDRHHHHHANDSSVTGTDQCPIGHMLSSVAAADTEATAEIAPGTDLLEEVLVAVALRTISTAYRSRAPPAR
jgi:hypothetical protein